MYYCIVILNHELGSQPKHLLQERRLCAHPFLEIYREGQIQFMAPLARQGDFYVPEVRQRERRLSEEEDLHSDTDISGMCTSCYKHIYFIVLAGKPSVTESNTFS